MKVLSNLFESHSTRASVIITPNRHIKNTGGLCNFLLLSKKNISAFHSGKKLPNEIMYFDVLRLKAVIFLVEDRLLALLLVKKKNRSLFKQLTAELALLKLLLKRAKRVPDAVFAGSKGSIHFDPSKNILYLQSCDCDIFEQWLEKNPASLDLKTLQRYLEIGQFLDSFNSISGLCRFLEKNNMYQLQPDSLLKATEKAVDLNSFKKILFEEDVVFRQKLYKMLLDSPCL